MSFANTCHHLPACGLLNRTLLVSGRISQKTSFRSVQSTSKSVLLRPLVPSLQVTRAQAQAAAATKEEYYEATLDKPMGVRFSRGNDGAAYIVKVDPKLGDVADGMEVGDKVVAVSASFGNEIWDARNFGQVMYAIKTRNGAVYMKVQKMFGDLSALQEEEMTEAERQFKAERDGGNYGVGTREMQARNYVMSKELDRQRREIFDDGLSKFRAGKLEEAVADFENVISLEPKKYIGDNFSRFTNVYRFAQYNLACCYSALKQFDAALEALETALTSGFEDYAKCRSDPNLKGLREGEPDKFKRLINSYDEGVINEAALDAVKNLFGFFKK